MDTQNQKKVRKKGKRILLLAVLLICSTLLVVFSAVFKGWILGQTQVSTTDGSAAPVLEDNGSALQGAVSSMSPEEVLDQLREQQVNVTDKISSHITFPNGKEGSTGTWEVENLPSNDVIMQCEVVLNGETIAKSVPIQPGEHIDHISLLQDVESGTSEVTALISYYSTNTQDYLGQAAYQISMTVS